MDNIIPLLVSHPSSSHPPRTHTPYLHSHTCTTLQHSLSLCPIMGISLIPRLLPCFQCYTHASIIIMQKKISVCECESGLETSGYIISISQYGAMHVLRTPLHIYSNFSHSTSVIAFVNLSFNRLQLSLT